MRRRQEQLENKMGQRDRRHPSNSEQKTKKQQRCQIPSFQRKDGVSNHHRTGNPVARTSFILVINSTFYIFSNLFTNVIVIFQSII